MNSLRTNCTNCGSNLDPQQKFCSNCGQKTDVHRFTLPHFFHEMIHAFTHADKGIFLLILELFKSPGKVLFEYIDGFKRKKYFNPFTFIVLIGGFTLFMNTTFKPYKDFDFTEGVKKNNIALPVEVQERSNKMNAFFRTQSKILLLGSVPISALAMWLMYRRRKLYFAEHLVAMTFITGSLGLFMSLLVVPLQAIFFEPKHYASLSFITLFFQCVYFAWAYHGWMKRRSSSNFFLALIVQAVNILFWMIFTGLLGSLYMMWPMIAKS